MTIPTLMHKINNMVLENQFKKAYANLQNAFRATVNDDMMPFVPNPTTGSDVNTDPEFGQQLALKYKWSRKIPNGYSVSRTIKKFTKDDKIGDVPNCSKLFSYQAYELSDGSTLGYMQNCHALWITLDTNGLNNKPNALGHDIFIFKAEEGSATLIGSPAEAEKRIGENDDIEGTAWVQETQKYYSNNCSLTGKSTINGAGCAKFAIQNKCPWDASKTYWQCLP